ncbi:unnamed protein product [Phyllotreta striolata]|uniref:Gamma-glutamylcyclotransferase family protein n=1 Tax=Phyllotreta striolata TaxID=444603 RepID=A0A9N9XQD8_PHYSR|nr:unnamed protein product [Phyllotreta striolata]
MLHNSFFGTIVLIQFYSMATSTSSGLHKVFVYGTLKTGEPNHLWFTKSNGYHKFIGQGKTVEKFPLIIATKYNVPFILKSPGNGTNIVGEVYEVDDKVFADLDILEDHPTFYVREKFNVSLLDSARTEEVWIYVIKNFNPKLLEEPFYECYSSTGSHGKKYVERYLRDGSLDYREVLR